MLSFFKHKQQQYKTKVQQERIAASIANGITGIQQQWAISMQRGSERLSATAKKVALTAFCLLSAGYSIYLMTGRSATKKGKSLSIAAIQLPGYSSKTPDYRIRNYSQITAAEHLKMKRFIYYMDNLSQTQQGKKVADSIVLSRPGLEDSVALIEKLYQLQSSTK